MKKTFTLLLISLVTIGFIYAFIYFLGMKGISFALGLNFILMGGVLFFTETLKSPLRANYFNEKSWEQRGKVYEYLGINIYRKLLVWTGWEKLNKQTKPVGKQIDTLTNLHYRTKQDELGHLIIFVIVLGFNVFMIINFGFRKSAALFVMNIILNLYPIFLQRYNRPRIARALRLHASRRS